MNALELKGLRKSFGKTEIIRGVDLAVKAGERIGVIGPNGAGKSTLLRILAGAESPDSGERVMQRDLALAYVTQVDRLPEATALAVVAAPLIAAGHDHHEAETTAEVALLSHGFPDPLVATASLSGGWKKRLSLVRALAGEPAVLLLDEPTNHLDAESVQWLEKHLIDYPGNVILVTHDRYFLDNVVNWILELDRGKYFIYEGNYSTYLDKKAKRLSQEEREDEGRRPASTAARVAASRARWVWSCDPACCWAASRAARSRWRCLLTTGSRPSSPAGRPLRRRSSRGGTAWHSTLRSRRPPRNGCRDVPR